jgi:hypothetical protein
MSYKYYRVHGWLKASPQYSLSAGFQLDQFATEEDKIRKIEYLKKYLEGNRPDIISHFTIIGEDESTK